MSLLVEVVSSACSSFGHAASGGALAPEPPRATGVGPESHRFCPFLFVCVCVCVCVCDRTSLSDLRSGGNWRVGQQYSGSQRSASE